MGGGQAAGDDGRTRAGPSRVQTGGVAAVAAVRRSRARRLLALTAVGLAVVTAAGLPSGGGRAPRSAASRPPLGARILPAVPLQRRSPGTPTAVLALLGEAPPARAAATTSSGVPGRPTSPAAGPAGCPARPGAVVMDAPGSGRTVALTFDDGPSEWTPAVLDILARYHVHATFFVIGQAAATDPAELRRIAAEGHQLGNHSWSHRYPRDVRGGWTRAFLRTELSRTDAALKRATAVVPCWFRPPGGFLTAVPASARAAGKSVALWSVDTLDWREQPIEVRSDPGARRQHVITRRAVVGAGLPHPVVLMHDGGGWRGATVRSLPAVIRYYRAKGYRFVRLDGRA
jgi:peptidoglycan-N-acetylglucosamine deacetylase